MTKAQVIRQFGVASRSRTAAPTATNSTAWSREWRYFAVVMAVWCFSPLLRRLLDWHNGVFSHVPILSVLPYLATLPLAAVCFRPERIARLNPAIKLFAWIWAAAFTYGLLVALAIGDAFGGVFEALQYLVPVLAGLWLAGLDLDRVQIFRRLATIIGLLAVIVAAYGIVQFVQPPAWDAFWVKGSGIISQGSPTPFSLRIFSTLNSTGPAADFFALAIVGSLPFFRLSNVRLWPYLCALASALLLTLVREAWVGVLVGVAVYLATSPRRIGVLFVLLPLALFGSVLVASLPQTLGAGSDSDVISTRIATLGDVSHDPSALTRTGEIVDSLQEGLADPIGIGLGQIGASSILSKNPDSPFGNVLDSGYLARFLELGWAGFATYAFVVIGSFIALIRSLARESRGGGGRSTETRSVVAACIAICATLLWADAAGDAHIALDGLMFWIALGVGLPRNMNGRQTTP